MPVEPMAADPAALREAVLREFFWLLGVPEESLLRQTLHPVLDTVVGRFKHFHNFTCSAQRARAEALAGRMSQAPLTVDHLQKSERWEQVWTA